MKEGIIFRRAMTYPDVKMSTMPTVPLVKLQHHHMCFYVNYDVVREIRSSGTHVIP
jgi:hypothetical protein